MEVKYSRVTMRLYLYLILKNKLQDGIFKIGFGSVPESPAAVPHFWEFIDSVDFVDI